MLFKKKDIICDSVVALAGNPNVGKSTVFNAFTGMNQHTGNWPGKTVSNASGIMKYKDNYHKIYDLPGIYSILAHSEEEVVARDFICFENSDLTVVVCDACSLMRNLNLVLQIMEITNDVIVCVNLIDEAKKKGISIDVEKLSKVLGVDVVATSARNGKGLDILAKKIDEYQKNKRKTLKIKYPLVLEDAIKRVEAKVKYKIQGKMASRWVSINLIKNDITFIKSIDNYLGLTLIDDDLSVLLSDIKLDLEHNNITKDNIDDIIVSCINDLAEDVSNKVTHFSKEDYNSKDRKLDRILTNKYIGIPIMIALLAIIFWITIIGANYPSDLLYNLFFSIEDKLYLFLISFLPIKISNMLVFGMYRTLAWVVSVMLPPMVIFFPLFTLLEDLGYLPRIAFNTDKIFHRCSSCGKQCLTMAMGFGCNAVGVTGTRIIDSPRERLIATITNSFVPCNGRFPILIAIITMFIVGTNTSSFFSVLVLMIFILLGIFMTFVVSNLLSKTILKGLPSSFTLELPPYRKPQIGKVIVRSIFDRVIIILSRAVVVAIPAGIIIWLMANVNIGDITLLQYTANLLDPFGKLLGMDGVILLAFILGFPANEIVIPIIIMSYMATGNLTDFNNLVELKSLLINNGWTITTAISVMIFALFHWPCSTTCLTIYKETKSWKWTLISILTPTICGIIICLLFNFIIRLI